MDSISFTVGTLQNVLQAYLAFHAARDFPDDYAYIQLRAALLHETTSNWAQSVGLIDEEGEPLHEFRIKDPSPESANKALSSKFGAKPSAITDEPAVAEGEIKKRSAIKSAYKKLLKKTHLRNPDDAEHPGVVPRVGFILVKKERLEGYIRNAADLRNDLQITFPPLDQVQQTETLIKSFQALELTDSEKAALADEIPDKLSQKVFGGLMYQESEAGTTVTDVTVKDLAKFLVGDEFAENFNYKEFVKPPASRITIRGLDLSGSGCATVGDRYVSKSSKRGKTGDRGKGVRVTKEDADGDEGRRGIRDV